MKYAIVFPGQGSQSLGMLSDLSSNFSIVKDIFSEASDALDLDLWKLVQEDEDALNQTENTQPAMLAAGYATFKVLSQMRLICRLFVWRAIVLENIRLWWQLNH